MHTLHGVQLKSPCALQAQKHIIAQWTQGKVKAHTTHSKGMAFVCPGKNK
jgi:hypothetical protein